MSSSQRPLELDEISPNNPQGSRSSAQSRTSISTNSRSSTSATSIPDGEEITIGEIMKKPWKYIGYRGYSDFISSENDFYILRRFASLNARVALLLQDNISVLEGELRDRDEQYSRRDAEDVHNGSFRGDQENQEERYELVKRIHTALSEYNSLLLQQSKLQNHRNPFKQDIESINNWHHNNGGAHGAIAPEEREYLTDESDLLTISPTQKSPLRLLLDRSEKFRTLQF